MTAGEPSSEVLDEAHLSRITFGDAALAREVLGLFVQQADRSLSDMDGAEAGPLQKIAHRIKGSAQGIGAWKVAEAATAVEAAASGQGGDVEGAVALLRRCVQDAQSAIAAIMAGDSGAAERSGALSGKPI